MTDNPNAVYLDLDGIVPEKEVYIKLDKQDHKLAPITVDQFVKNLQTMQKLGTGKLSIEEEQSLMVEMLEQVFPSVPKGRLNTLTLLQLNTLINFSREHSGEKQVEAEGGTSTTNPPTGE